MKKTDLKRNFRQGVAKLALNVTKLNVNTNCLGYLHQSKLPKSAKKMRKF